ncbi:MAG: DUF3310 domain-containing protein [Planctomycetota bacterium]
MTTTNDDRADVAQPAIDPVERPSYYRWLAGIECIEVAEHFSLCLGAAIQYIWRAGRKGDAIEDLKKARWYIDREIKRLTARENIRLTTNQSAGDRTTAGCGSGNCRNHSERKGTIQ